MPVPQPSIDTPDVGLTTMRANDLLLAEFIHRSANDFAVACAEVHVASRLSSVAAMRDRLEVTMARLHALASIQRLLQPPHGEAIDIGNALCDLCQYQAEARFADQGAFIQLRTCNVQVDAERGSALLMIVSELLTNAARHAFAGPGGLVEVDLTTLGDTVLCRIGDNGVGLGAIPREGRTGTALVAELARSVNIGFAVPVCATGTRFELRMPFLSATAIASPSDD